MQLGGAWLGQSAAGGARARGGAAAGTQPAAAGSQSPRGRRRGAAARMASMPPGATMRIAELRQHAKEGRAPELKAVLADLKADDCLYEHMGARDAQGNTVFHIACYHGHAECAQLLEHSSCDTWAISNEGQSGLMMAAKQGHAALCRQLLPMADLEMSCKKGWTAFMYACAAGQADCVEVLVRADCDTKVRYRPRRAEAVWTRAHPPINRSISRSRGRPRRAQQNVLIGIGVHTNTIHDHVVRAW